MVNPFYSGESTTQGWMSGNPWICATSLSISPAQADSEPAARQVTILCEIRPFPGYCMYIVFTIHSVGRHLPAIERLVENPGVEVGIVPSPLIYLGSRESRLSKARLRGE